MSYNDFREPQLSESSQSDVEPQPNQFKITSNPGKEVQVAKNSKYNESSESDISSLSQEQDNERFPNQRLQNNKRTIELDNSDEGSDEESEESSIDIIEQRIRRMEVDLEAKIEKQKNSKESSLKKEKNIPVSNGFNPQLLSNPPLPPPQRIEVKNSLQIKKKEEEPVPIYSQSQNLNKMNIIQKSSHFHMKETTKSKEHEGQIMMPIKQSELYKESPKKKTQKKVNEEKGSPKLHKNQIQSKSSKGKSESNAVALLNKAHRQIDDMQKVIEQLRKENQNLKDQLKKSKKKQPTEQLSKLRKLSSGGDLKLQKQIQTLKAIESLQVKLKKSINKKMKSQGHNTNSNIIHNQF